MKNWVEVCLVAVVLAVVAPLSLAQSAAEVPMQRGISVDLPVSSNAVAVPAADKADALVVTVTQDGSVYLGVNRIGVAALADSVRSTLAERKEKTLYIKADAHVPYTNVVRVLDAVRATGVENITLLTAQRDSKTQAFPVAPKGLEMQVVRRR